MGNLKNINIKNLVSNRFDALNDEDMESGYKTDKGVSDERQDPEYGGKKNKKTNKYRYLYTKSKKRRYKKRKSLKIRKSRITRR